LYFEGTTYFASMGWNPKKPMEAKQVVPKNTKFRIWGEGLKNEYALLLWSHGEVGGVGVGRAAGRT
jgi:hypothetical protein